MTSMAASMTARARRQELDEERQVAPSGQAAGQRLSGVRSRIAAMPGVP